MENMVNEFFEGVDKVMSIYEMENFCYEFFKDHSSSEEEITTLLNSISEDDRVNYYIDLSHCISVWQDDLADMEYEGFVEYFF